MIERKSENYVASVGKSMEVTLVCVNHRVRESLGQGEPLVLKSVTPLGASYVLPGDLRLLLDVGSAFHGFFCSSLSILRKEGEQDVWRGRNMKS